MILSCNFFIIQYIKTSSWDLESPSLYEPWQASIGVPLIINMSCFDIPFLCFIPILKRSFFCIRNTNNNYKILVQTSKSKRIIEVTMLGISSCHHCHWHSRLGHRLMNHNVSRHSLLNLRLNSCVVWIIANNYFPVRVYNCPKVDIVDGSPNNVNGEENERGKTLIEQVDKSMLINLISSNWGCSNDHQVYDWQDNPRDESKNNVDHHDDEERDDETRFLKLCPETQQDLCYHNQNIP